MKKSFFMGLILLMGLLCACASGARQGTVYVDPKAAAGETAQSGEGEKPEQVLPGEKEAPEPEEEKEEEYIFRSGSIAIVPLEEADEVMERLTGLLSTFEADSCAYQGKDYYYYYPGFELTVNELEGVKRITAITLVDDTIKAEFSGGALGIGDGEQLLRQVLGGEPGQSYYEFAGSRSRVQIQLTEGRITAMVFRPAEETAGED